MQDMLFQVPDSVAADVFFGLIVLLSFAAAMTGVLFFLLAVRGFFRWATRATWNDVVRSSERKVFK